VPGTRERLAQLREDGGQQALVDRTTIGLNIVMGRFGFPSGRSGWFAGAAAYSSAHSSAVNRAA
jgi:ABC-type branched-subunit amino acid transport system permease subunit